MIVWLYALLATARSSLKSQRELALENLALRQQLAILHRKTKRPKLRKADRAFWALLSRSWPEWQSALILVKPETVIGWHRKGFKLYWTSESRNRGGRPPIDGELRALIRRMARENRTWGAPRIHGELLKLGFEVSEATVSRYTPSPTTQLRSTSSGTETRSMVRTSFVERMYWGSSRSSPRRSPPWQNPYCERVIGTLRRDCLDHLIVVGEQHLRRILRKHLEYDHGSRTHLALGKDAPEPRQRESIDGGKVVALSMVGGLHHRYTRRAA